jgi:hypothetical protein
MALRSTSKQELTIAFVLDEDALRQLISKIQSTIGQQTVTSFNVGFSDKTTITTSSISDVLSLPNSGLKTIEQIAFTITRGPSSAKTYKFKFLRRARKAIQALRGADSDTNKDRVGSAASNPNDGSADEALKVSVKFWNITGVSSVDYEIAGDEREVFYLTSAINESVLAVRTWYSKLAHTEAGWLGIILVPLASFGFIIIDYDARMFGMPLWLVLAVSLVGLLVLLFLLAKLKSWLFPIAVFAIGEGRKHNERLRFWRTTIGVAVILGFIVSIVSGLLVR